MWTVVCGTCARIVESRVRIPTTGRPSMDDQFAPPPPPPPGDFGQPIQPPEAVSTGAPPPPQPGAPYTGAPYPGVAPQAPQKKSKAKIIIIVVVAVLFMCCCASAGVAWWLYASGYSGIGDISRDRKRECR